ncbi:MAG: hypothetical protein ACU85V_01060 [Gammaproteobacteria bacterium]
MRTAGLLLLAILLPPAAGADTAVFPTVTEEQLRRFGHDRVEDARELLLGPTPPQAAAVDSRDCFELYRRKTELMRARLDHEPKFFDEPRHVAAVFTGTIWTPAFYYLPYRAVAATAAAPRRGQVTADLDALRRASAAARCFER